MTNQGVTSKALTESGVVTEAAHAGLLYGVNLYVAAAASSIIVKDGGASGATICTLALDGSVAANAKQSVTVTFPEPVVCSTDIYAVIAGAAATANVYYRQITL